MKGLFLPFSIKHTLLRTQEATTSECGIFRTLLWGLDEVGSGDTPGSQPKNSASFIPTLVWTPS